MPSDRFSNLARPTPASPDVVLVGDAAILGELEYAGIPASSFGDCVWPGEVPTHYIGNLGMWTFERRWYYWSAKGPGLPVEVAERIHETHGTQVRVDGHCGCPHPREWFKGFGVGLYHIDTPEGLKVLADALRSVYDPDKDPNATPRTGKRS